jgi:hypothetical protein
MWEFSLFRKENTLLHCKDNLAVVAPVDGMIFCLWTAATNGHNADTPGDTGMESHGGMIEHLDATLSNTNPTLTDLSLRCD